MILRDGQNALGRFGAAALVGRDGNKVQIQIICDTEDEARAITARISADITATGQTTLVIGGTLDEMASAGMKT